MSDFLKFMMVMQGMSNNQNDQPNRQQPAHHQHDRSNEMNAVISHIETLREVILEQQRTIRELGKELREIRQLSAQSLNHREHEVIKELARLLEESNHLQQQRGRIPSSKRHDMNQQAKNLYQKLVQSN